MATLLMRISAPMQAWGTQSHFSHRDTGREPSQSGIIGLICAALGRPRQEPIDDLRSLRMAVRTDQPGAILRDYHTAAHYDKATNYGGYYTVGGKINRKNAITSERYYLSDAKFLVGLEGDRAVLETLQAALQQPAWFLFFGRKAFLPAERVWLPDGLQNAGLQDALSRHPWLGQGEPAQQLQLLIEDDKNGSIVRHDQPICFQPRRFVPRRLRREYLPNPAMQKEGDDVSLATAD